MAVFKTAFKKILNVLVLPLSFMMITSMAQAQVTSLTATLAGNGYVNLSWTNPVGFTPQNFNLLVNGGTPLNSLQLSSPTAGSFLWAGAGPSSQDSVVIEYWDGQGSWIPSASVNIILPQANRAPVANAGPDQTVSSGATVTLDGRGSTDLDNDSLTYSWQVGSLGWQVALVGATTAQPTFTAPTLNPGASNATVYVRLTVRDGALNSTTYDEVEITVQAPGAQNPSNPQAPSQTPASSSTSTSSTTATATTAAVTSDVYSRTTVTVSGNKRMMDMALGRVIADSNSGAAGIGNTLSLSTSNGPRGLRLTALDINADDNGGSLFSGMSYMNVANGWRRVGFAEMSYQDTQGVGSTLSLNGRVSQERYLTDETLYGYFMGAELHRSNIEGSFAGNQNSWGVLAGAYAVTKSADGLIGSAYGALGFNRSDLSISDGTSTVTDNYDTRSIMLGASISGDLDYKTYRLRPSLAANYSQTDIGTLDMTETISGTASDLAVAVGTVRFIDIVATPEFIFTVDPIGAGLRDTELSVAPRVSCERRDAETVTRVCGSGLAFGMTSKSDDGMTTIKSSVSFDRIGGQDRRGLNLQAEIRF